MSPTEVLKKYWGYSSFRPLQLDIIDNVLKGNDTLALLPTGGGKSVCFQVPALCIDGICLVVCPLIALMKDQVAQLTTKGIEAVALHSSLNYKEAELIMDKVLNDKYKFVYVSPEKLQSKRFIDILEQLNVTILAIDEAHCISQWGYDFRPPYLEIAKIKEIIPQATTIALTASATLQVQADIISKLEFKKNHAQFSKSYARPNISYNIRHTESVYAKLVNILQSLKGCTIIYCRNRKKTQEIAQYLKTLNYSSTYYHAGLPNTEREQRQQAWISNEVQIIVCTNAFGMGIDKPDVRLVIHIDLPDNLESYYQEAGRAGRDEQKAFALILTNNTEIDKLQLRIATQYPPLEFIHNVYEAVCSYLEINTNEGQDNVYDFDIQDFVKSAQLEIMPTLSALKILAQNNYLQFNESYYSPSKIWMPLQRQRLEQFQQDFPNYAELTKTILRIYAGITSGFVTIYENQILRLLKNYDHEKLNQDLEFCQRMGLLYYNPVKDTPQIYIAQNRVPYNNFKQDEKKYNFLKTNFTNRLAAFTHYLKEPQTCRTQIICTYFGQTDYASCGVCDTCIYNKNKKAEANINTEICSQLKNKNNLTLQDLTLTIALPQKAIQQALSTLLHQEIITFNTTTQTYTI